MKTQFAWMSERQQEPAHFLAAQCTEVQKGGEAVCLDHYLVICLSWQSFDGIAPHGPSSYLGRRREAQLRMRQAEMTE